MYARVVTNQIQPGKVDQWVALVRDSIVPALRQQRGFKGFVVLTDPGSAKTIGYSMWETEADLRLSEASGSYQQQISKLSSVLAVLPIREAYQLTVLA